MYRCSPSHQNLNARLAADVRHWMRRHEWANYRTFCHDLRRFLRGRLSHPRYRSLGAGVQTGRGGRDADLSIGTRIGIKIINSFTSGSKQWIRRELSILTQQYDTVIVIGFDLQPEHIDSWRNIGRGRTRDDGSLVVMTTLETFSYPIATIATSVVLALAAAGYAYLGGFSYASYWFFETVNTVDVGGGMYAGGLIAFLCVVLVYVLYVSVAARREYGSTYYR